jgi:uncharacterized membrane protein
LKKNNSKQKMMFYGFIVLGLVAIFLGLSVLNIVPALLISNQAMTQLTAVTVIIAGLWLGASGVHGLK